jgi:Fic family protein
MTDAEVNIHVLDAAYKPFPTFEEWAAQTSVDTVRWERYNSTLKNRAGLSPEILQRAHEVAKRAAALDTGAIEGLYTVDRGFTYTVAFETAAWEAALSQKGEHVRSLFEAQLHAYDYVLDLATKAEPISEAAIRALHEEVTRAQPTYHVITAVGPQEQALPKGQYKVLPNHVRNRKGVDHSYAPVDVTPAEMARLVNELRSDTFLAAHPVLQAAYAHYGFVVIHPFADGNGRVARALASAFTYRSIAMPIVILSEHKDRYIDALESADGGAYQVFVDFILARALDTITLVDESVRCALAPDTKKSLAAIQRLYLTKGGYTHEQVDEAGQKLLNALKSEIEALKFEKSSKIATNTTAHAGGLSRNMLPSYRNPLSGLARLTVTFDSLSPVAAQATRNYSLLLPKNAAGTDDILLLRSEKQDEKFPARMDEVAPAISGVLQMRLKMLAERIVSEMLFELSEVAENTIKERL